MIKETGRIVAVDSNYLWLETINKGTCGACAAEPGCGQSLLSRWLSHRQYLKVSLDGRDAVQFKINDIVDIGVPENVVVISSLLVYCLPLLGLIVGAAIGQATFATDFASILGAVIGLIGGSLMVRLYTWVQRNNLRLRPVILDIINA